MTPPLIPKAHAVRKPGIYTLHPRVYPGFRGTAVDWPASVSPAPHYSTPHTPLPQWHWRQEYTEGATVSSVVDADGVSAISGATAVCGPASRVACRAPQPRPAPPFHR